MTDQRKHLIKMLGTMVYIMILPVLFFTYIGDNPEEVEEQSTREIAIVNEDIGAEQEGLSLRFGQEVSSLINDSSNFNWTVVGRSAAENGLESRVYDAVFYIPSDFSEAVLNFKDSTPAKASIEFELQPQLNAKNSQRVQRELESARNKINSEMSTIYWSYIAQEIENVKVAFEDILEKEIDFQEAMNSFYSTGSQTLAEEISDQKEMLNGLKSSIEDGEEGTTERIQTIEEADETLTAFVDNVEVYKEYQQRQQTLLNETHAESQRLIQESSSEISANQNQAMLSYADQQASVLENVDDIKDQINATTTIADSLNEERTGAVGNQLQELVDLQAVILESYKQDLYVRSLNQVQEVLIPLRNAIVEADAPQEPEQPEEPGDDVPELPEVPEAALDLIEDERAALGNTAAEVEAVKETISLISPDVLPEMEELILSLDEITASLQTIDAGLEEKQQSDAVWQELFNDLAAQIDEYEPPVEEIEEEEPDTSFRDAIWAIEEEILSSDVLSDSRKAELNSFFNQGIESTNGQKLISYAKALGQYAQLVNEIEKTEDPVADEMLASEDLIQNYQSILAVGEQERQGWEALSGSVVSAGNNVDDFSVQADNLMANYASIIEEQQGLILGELETIVESSQNLSSTLAEVNAEEAALLNGESDPLTRGSNALSYQSEIGSEIVSLNGLITSLSDRQEGVISSTSVMQEEVERVQLESSLLNTNWEENVLFTMNVEEDLNEIFNNAIVDGQDNGYVYDFLSNPVAISGETLEEEVVNLPPVVMLVILLASALLIGFFTQHFSLSPWFIQLSLFGLLNVVVGLMISIFGLTIYPMQNDQSIMWSVWTVMLLIAASGLVFTAFSFSTTIGWIVTVLLMLLFTAPLLDLILPNFTFEDPITRVYLSIQYGAQSLFPMAVIVLSIIIVVLGLLAFTRKSLTSKEAEDHEAA
ncbi:type VII secretion protein EsaA [Jeotgalibacillus sp. ET6]|uniref:type VII secretion protein EsaA n=1 Tax=Jeotgalibacillus sp. ET6 TaxID=3037260 RepID=UPI0024186A82|nr:type VII secretion protein EsaA [Jeotgalibacillus sp. ET6]MDG5471925.1 type VII secretion protein EsaA [Jeotgalibacillus sp. ET6]